MRLTNHIRETILDDVINHAFGKRRQEQVTAIEQFALKLYNLHYPADIQKKMSSFPSGAFHRSSQYRVKLQRATESGPRMMYLYLNLPEPKMFFASQQNPDILLGDPLNAEYWSIDNKGDELAKEIGAAQDQAKATVYSVSSTNKLMDIWPAIAEFIPQGELPKNLPMLPPKDLNKKLGIPTAQIL